MNLRALLTAAGCVFSAVVVGTLAPDPGPVYAFGSGVPTTRLVLTHRAGDVLDEEQLSEESGIDLTVLHRLDPVRTLVELPTALTGSELSNAASAIDSADGVMLVEPDARLQISMTPDDPVFPQQWYLRPSEDSAGAANVTLAWDVTTGSDAVTVAVLDTGLTAHPDLVGERILPGYDMVSDVDTANDGDGRDADSADPGDWIDAADQSNPSFYGCSRTASTWHGTHVSGIAAATSNNATGVAGVAPLTRLLPVRVLGKCGGFTGDIADGVRWAAGLAVPGVPLNPNPARVINMSLGGPSPTCPTVLQDAITAARDAGALVVVAAGNEAVNASGYTPSNCDGAFVVAGGDDVGGRAYFSNYGSVVDILAPGTIIHSTLNSGITTPLAATEGSLNGTSMAAPIVAGTAALMLAINPQMPLNALELRLRSSARAFPNLSALMLQYPNLYRQCTKTSCGAGVVDARQAVESVAVPDVPRSLVAETGAATATIRWDAPAYTGTTPIVAYRVEDSRDNRTCQTDAETRSCTFTGLNGGTRTFTVVAVNGGGGTSSASVNGLVTTPESTTTTTTTTTTPPTTTTTPPTTTTTPPTTTTTASPTTTTTAPPPDLAAPKNLVVRIEGDDLVIFAAEVPGARSYYVQEGSVVLYYGTRPAWRIFGRANVSSTAVYSMYAVSSTGTPGASASVEFTVTPPPLPKSISTSVSKGYMTVRITPAPLTSPDTTWCLFLDFRQRICRLVENASVRVKVAKGTRTVQVKMFSPAGTSKFSTAKRVKVKK